MQGTVLNRILRRKALWLEQRQVQQPLSHFYSHLQVANRSFYAAFSTSQTAFILECKKASPSQGLIREDFDPVKIANVYRHYASVISVLTDEDDFQGSFDDLRAISDTVTQPILCKDFIISEYQIYLARYYQADAILLMLSVVDDQQYCQFAALAHSLQMGVLTEVSSSEELARAIALNAKVIGINNRDLRDLSIDLNRTRTLAAQAPAGVTLIAESGIHQYAQVRALSPFVHGFLIGSALMADPDLRSAVCRVLLGENKVCGLTRPEEAITAYRVGAVYGGLIFVASSPRVVDIPQATQIIAAAPLHYVGVFSEHDLTTICHTVAALGLFAVQLHGGESADYIAQLRQLLPQHCQIWKALTVGAQLPPRDVPHVDRYLLDNAQGGSGQCFNWQWLVGEKLQNTILAGGLNADNCAQAASFGCAGLDFNSGVESQVGQKDVQKLEAVFQTLRRY